jgi:hypothetical protein
MVFNEEHHRYLPENLKLLLEEPPALYKIYPLPLQSEQALVRESYFPRGEAFDCDEYALVEKATAENKTDTSTKTSEEEEKRRSVTKSS